MSAEGKPHATAKIQQYYRDEVPFQRSAIGAALKTAFGSCLLLDPQTKDKICSVFKKEMQSAASDAKATEWTIEGRLTHDQTLMRMPRRIMIRTANLHNIPPSKSHAISTAATTASSASAAAAATPDAIAATPLIEPQLSASTLLIVGPSSA